jgi:hypothetical protein
MSIPPRFGRTAIIWTFIGLLAVVVSLCRRHLNII